MSRTTLPIFESSILWRYFDGISTAVAKRMLRGSVPNEENLTFLLCELLDEGASGLHNLDFSLEQVKAELENSDAGVRIDIGFETHEHSKHFESKYSGADLGIVFSIDHPMMGKVESAVLVQAKRLFTPRNQNKFSLHSQYSSFDPEQAMFLRQFQNKFGVNHSIFYLWYNPPSTGFSDEQAKHIRAYEAAMGNNYRFWYHPFFEDFLNLGYSFNAGILGQDNEAEDNKRKVWRSTQPALRLTRLGDLGKDTKVIALKDRYEKALEDPIKFFPFADFFLTSFSASRWGSSEDEWIALAKGQKVPLSKLKDTSQTRDEPNLLANLENAPPPRHTLKVSITSSLPKLRNED